MTNKWMRTVFFLLAVLFCLSACGGGSYQPPAVETEPPVKEIALTMDNYKEYLRVTVDKPFCQSVTGYNATLGTSTMTIYGVAPGEFKNVRIKIKIGLINTLWCSFFEGDDISEETSYFITVYLPSDGEYEEMLATVLALNNVPPMSARTFTK